MDPQRFARVKAVVAEAAALLPPTRPAFLEAACAGDEELRREVESLLAHETVSGFLSATEVEGALAGALAGSMAPDETPAQIGPYQVQEMLGQGGMGVVYRATQEAPLRREVALKLVTSASRFSEVLARFEAERQTLARLDHPAIARIFDAGTAPDGRPYFVMELVRGQAITAFADDQRLTTRQRLDLFLAVCGGVQHAHQKGVIHRDLKPSNILVTAEADGPRPHVIDFGIARAIESDAEDRLTLAGHLLGTLDYMSPEQAGLLEVGVDTRTDVYALGVVLYQLLTGARPYRFTRVTAGEIQRVLGGPLPPLPSTAVQGGAGAPDAPDCSAARQSTPERLRRQLRGDLDNIVLKSLARDPEQRYASVEQLSADLRRHLAGEPVEARAASWRYRAGKFVRRHTAAVAGAAAVVILLAAFGLVTARQARVLARERDHARRQAETARQVSSFLVELFRVADPSESKGNAVTAREILDRGAANIPAALAHQPAVEARLLATMGEAYHALGLYERAGSLLEQARVRYESLPSADPGELATTLDLIGDLAHDLRDMPKAEQYARRALELRRRTFGPEHEDVARSLINLATAVRGNGRPAEAEPLYREGVAAHRSLFGDEDPRVAWALFNFGWALHQQGRVDEAEPLYEEAAAVQRRMLGDTHAELADTLNSLAGIPFHRGQYQRAAAIWEEALGISQRLYGDEHAMTARAHHNLARARLALGDYARAESLYRRAVEINLKMIGPDHPHTAITRHSHGVTLGRLGRHAEAERELRSALAVREAKLGADSPQTGSTRAALALVLLDRGRRDEALAQARRAADIGEAEAVRWPSLAAAMIESLATVLAAQGDSDQALPRWRRALALRESAGDSSPPERALARAGLGQALRETGQPDAGQKELRAAAAVLQQQLPVGHPERMRVQALLERSPGREALR